jgi:hypothetical protein
LAQACAAAAASVDIEVNRASRAAAADIEVNLASRVASVGSAALAACLPSAPHDIALAQTRLRQRLRGKDISSDSAELAGGELLKSISVEILALQESLDESHLACEKDNRIAKARISQLELSNAQIAQDVGATEAKIASAAAQLQPVTEKIQQLRDQIQKMRTHCEKEGVALKNSTEPSLVVDMKRERLESECRNSVGTLNDNLRERVAHLGKSQVALAQSVAMKTGFQQQMKDADSQMKRLIQTSQAKEQSCREVSEQYQREMCGLVELRQSIFWKFVDPDKTKVIQDCKVSDWVSGPCSSSCRDKEGGADLTQKLTRSKIVSETAFGVPCPAMNKTVTCNEGVLCPRDCKMSGWSGWAKCSRKCGGGEQYRTRTIVQRAVGAGEACGNTTQTKVCNVGRCQASCTFGAWTP